MPETELVFYREEDGYVPLLEWFEEIPKRARAKCRVRIERLRRLGHEIRRPEADYLRDGIYELRGSLQGIHYRMLYFFYDKSAVVVSHGLVKDKKVPSKDIDLAVVRKHCFEMNPENHTFKEELRW